MKEEFERIVLCCIGAGTTGSYQPLDRSMMRAFKLQLRDSSSRHLAPSKKAVLKASLFIWVGTVVERLINHGAVNPKAWEHMRYLGLEKLSETLCADQMDNTTAGVPADPVEYPLQPPPLEPVGHAPQAEPAELRPLPPPAEPAETAAIEKHISHFMALRIICGAQPLAQKNNCSSPRCRCRFGTILSHIPNLQQHVKNFQRDTHLQSQPNEFASTGTVLVRFGE